MNTDKSEIVFVLDRSGSMQDVFDETIRGFNKFVKEQREVPGTCIMGLLTFATYPTWVYRGKPIDKVEDLTDETYRADGSTALLDAMVMAIDETGERLNGLPEDAKPGTVIVVILTDGIENASRKYTYADVRARVKHQKEVYNWKFVFLAANIEDVVLEASHMGISGQSTAAFAADAAGTEYAFAEASSRTTSYRTAGSAGKP